MIRQMINKDDLAKLKAKSEKWNKHTNSVTMIDPKKQRAEKAAWWHKRGAQRKKKVAMHVRDLTPVTLMPVNSSCATDLAVACNAKV